MRARSVSAGVKGAVWQTEQWAGAEMPARWRQVLAATHGGRGPATRVQVMARTKRATRATATTGEPVRWIEHVEAEAIQMICVLESVWVKSATLTGATDQRWGLGPAEPLVVTP